jgi:hypothetical protein
MQLRRILSLPDLFTLSDFVAACIIFVYRNGQTSRQAIAFLDDAALRDFPFSPDESDILMRALLLDAPPRIAIDAAAAVVARFCRADGQCRRVFLEFVRGHDTGGDFLKAACALIAREKIAKFTPAELRAIQNCADQNGNVGPKEPGVTPTAEKMRQMETQKAIERTFRSCRRHSVAVFIVSTIVVAGFFLLYHLL